MINTHALTLGMLMGYVIAKEISPDDIKDKVNVPFDD